MVQTIAETTPRERVALEGRVHSIAVAGHDLGRTVTLNLNDGTGTMLVLFTGRSHVAGVDLGTRIHVDGRVLTVDGRPALMNPAITVLAPAH